MVDTASATPPAPTTSAGSGTSPKERVYAAAEKISADRNPTVSSVREAAGVSNADATRYLKVWREEKAAAGSHIAATPQPLLEQAARLAGSVWADAVALAGEQHAAVETRWAKESQDKDAELAELVTDLDRITTEHATETAALKAELTAAAERAAASEARAVQAEETATAARAETGTLANDLAAARARAETLQQAHDALIQRITPQDTKKPRS
ncbi:DNA-binding protein [Arthrobacter sp. EH-1B-1]|uniref:DNA-binding protein n=1 Tax=Arthrobacter vasquezii TaxID=2977629 RepID=A0ABT6CXT7_9MICC|nr:DNA-binding protein [Arthrobacter vasquezii]MDF9278843.1 DNA-binding protein [Arthrobacter vasquezii]